MALTKIKTGGIADNAITNAKMADDAIDSADFANASIDNVHVATGLDAVKLADGTVTNTEFQYINTLSSNAQTQISASLPKAGGTMTGHLILTNNSVSLQYLDAAGTAARVLYQDNADTLILGNPTTVDDIRFDVDTYGEGAMMILSSGNVGIGITSPATKLHLSGAVGATSIIKMSVSDGTAWEFGERATAGHFTFRELDGNKDVLTMKSTGSVGIGTASLGSSQKLTLYDNGGGGYASIGLQSDHTGTGNSQGSWIGIDNNTDMGLYVWNYETKDILFGTNALERMRIDSSGNIGIGTNSPAKLMEISSGTASQGLRMNAGSSYYHGILMRGDTLDICANTSSTGAGGDIRFNIRSETAPQLTISATTSTFAGVVNVSSSTTGALNILSTGTGNATYDAKLYISKSSDQDWLIRANSGNDNYGMKLRGGGSYGIAIVDHTPGTYRARISYNGYIYSTDGLVHDIDSDERLKENVSNADSQWKLFKDLPLQKFKWKDRRHGDNYSHGWIAQEVQKKYPDLVEEVPQPKEDIDAGLEDEEYLTVKTGIIQRLGLKALQEAMEKIENLEAKVTALENA